MFQLRGLLPPAAPAKVRRLVVAQRLVRAGLPNSRRGGQKYPGFARVIPPFRLRGIVSSSPVSLGVSRSVSLKPRHETAGGDPALPVFVLVSSSSEQPPGSATSLPLASLDFAPSGLPAVPGKPVSRLRRLETPPAAALGFSTSPDSFRPGKPKNSHFFSVLIPFFRRL